MGFSESKNNNGNYKVKSWESFNSPAGNNFWAYKGSKVISWDDYLAPNNTNIAGTKLKSGYENTFSSWTFKTTSFLENNSPAYIFKPGYYPQFTGGVTYYGTNKVFHVSRSNKHLIIDDKTYSPSDFKDGVIPTWIYVILQGGGGGGGYGGWGIGEGDGSGGGGGACIIGILKMPSNWYFSPGSGGAGGGSSGGTIDSKNGGDGSPSIIGYFTEDQIIAYGGKGGAYRGAGGAGGETYISPDNPFQFIPLHIVPGGRGGKQYDFSKSTAEDVSSALVYHSAFSDNEYCKLSLSYHSHGKWKSGGYSGPGGASQFGDGGDSGDNDNASGGYNCQGESGTKGSGGGGSRYYFGQYHGGGPGGAGFITLYLGLKEE